MTTIPRADRCFMTRTELSFFSFLSHDCRAFCNHWWEKGIEGQHQWRKGELYDAYLWLSISMKNCRSQKHFGYLYRHKHLQMSPCCFDWCGYFNCRLSCTMRGSKEAGRQSIKQHRLYRSDWSTQMSTMHISRAEGSFSQDEHPDLTYHPPWRPRCLPRSPRIGLGILESFARVQASGFLRSAWEL